MSELIMPFGIGFLIGIILFVVFERTGLLDKWLGLEPAPKASLKGKEMGT